MTTPNPDWSAACSVQPGAPACLLAEWRHDSNIGGKQPRRRRQQPADKLHNHAGLRARSRAEAERGTSIPGDQAPWPRLRAPSQLHAAQGHVQPGGAGLLSLWVC